MRRLEGVRQLVLMGDEAYLIRCSARAVTIWRAISEPSRSLVEEKRLVEQHETIGRDMVDDVAHPAELLVEPAAAHSGIFLPLEMREDPFADTGLEAPGRDEHAALHHQLCEAEAA